MGGAKKGGDKKGASGGASADKKEAKGGTSVKVTLHNLKIKAMKFYFKNKKTLRFAIFYARNKVNAWRPWRKLKTAANSTRLLVLIVKTKQEVE